jgi:membrane protease YdiL (CAAX protease family)
VSADQRLERPRRRLASLTGLVFALGIPVATTLFTTGDIPTNADGVAAVLLNEAFMWTLTLAVLAIVLFWERRPLASIGLGRPTWNALQFGAGLAMALLVLAVTAGAVAQALGGLSEPGNSEAMVMALPLWVQLFAAVSAGFTEEILFRGYAIERVTELTGRRWLGAALPVFVFGAVHAPFWGVAHALVAGLTGLWLTLAYLWRRNLWTNIAAHALLDVLVFVALSQAPIASA